MSGAKPRSVNFSKYSGAGNDFLIVDERHQPGLGEASVIAKALCRRAISVGADGLITLSVSDVDGGAVARMRLWNADGSTAEFSGNAARCAVRYLVDEGLATGEEVLLQTDIGVVRGHIDGTISRIVIPGLARVYPARRLRVEGKDLIGTYVLVGVPFFVVLHDDPDELPVRYLGRAIRNHAALRPAGANVDFVRVDDEQGLYFRVYERGVENETLSSGTGSIAAALAAAAADRVASPVSCRARGGTLTVRFRQLTAAELVALAAATREADEAATRDRPAETAQGEVIGADTTPQAPPGSTEAAAPDATDTDTDTDTDGEGTADLPGGDSGQSTVSEPPATPTILDGDPIVFGDIEIEGDTRKVLTGTAFADALRLR
jgi:diaminopimelate epimerase